MRCSLHFELAASFIWCRTPVWSLDIVLDQTYPAILELLEVASALCQELTVTVSQGTLRGQSVTSSYGLTYNSYLGIPYAQPPVGDLRFKAPQDPVAWEGTRDATKFGSSCVQGVQQETVVGQSRGKTTTFGSRWVQDSTAGSEDCLYLNVYTPQASALCQELTVTVSQGTLRGQSVTSSYGLTYNSYLGIPYAQPPVGDLRFKAPQDPVAWEGTRDATKFGSSCVQGVQQETVVGQSRGKTTTFGSRWVQDSTAGSEDCLYLNVYTPQNTSLTDRLPVMVSIHGGAFQIGSGSQDGFLSLEGTDVSGNAGLKDQVAALRWIKNNIASFGGDPNSLFHHAISESGAALNPGAFHKNTQPYAFNLGAKLGLNTTDAQELATFLRNTSTNDLESVHLTYKPFVPATEYPISGEETFLPSDPYTLVTSGNFNKVPYITGSNLLEGRFFAGTDEAMNQSSYWEPINNDFERLVPLELGLTKGSQQSQEVANKIKQFYFDNETLSFSSRDQYIDLITDEMFVCGIHLTVKAHSASYDNIYNYQFTFDRPTHGGEIQYIYYSGSVFTPGDVAYNVHNWLINLWASFAKTGVPSPGDGSVTWSPASSSNLYYLRINDTLTLQTDLEKNRMAFWEDIYKTYLAL
uniref:Carboxylesterase type B domain-containing protein n=1 Tax=Timema shepardi TaxID=629360 RepID=A0A7R9AVZ1_TIMSH|nr:unnamed protein product [Timema shepardi]